MATIYCSKATGNYAKIDFLDCTEEEAKVVEKHMYNWFSYFNEKKMFTWEYEQGRTDAVEHIYDAKNHLLPIGLIPMIKTRIKGFDNYKLAISEDIRALFTPKTPVTEEDIRKYAETLSMVNKEGKKITPYDHQVKLILRALNGRRISLMACTAAGKSLAMYIMSRYLLEKEHKKVLIITPSSALVEQLYSNFKDDYGWKEVDDYCTLIHGESKDKLTASDKQKLSDLNLGEEVMLKDITVSTWQSLQNKPDKFFTAFSGVVVDECLDEDTLITTKSGKVRIKDVKVGDFVLSLNTKTNSYEFKRVTETFVNHPSGASAKMLRLTFRDGRTIDITENHPVYTNNRGWVRAGNLTMDDDVEVPEDFSQQIKEFDDICKKCGYDIFVKELVPGKGKWKKRLSFVLSNGKRITQNKLLGYIKRLNTASKSTLFDSAYKDALFRVLFDAPTESDKKLCVKVGAIIGGQECVKLLKRTGKMGIGIVGKTAWNKGKHGVLPPPWNKGLTKNEDARLMKLSRDRSGQLNPMSFTKYKGDRELASKKLSAKIRSKILNGEYTPNTQNRLTHTKLAWNGISYRSSWEIAFHSLYPTLKYEKIRIEYTKKSDKSTHIYIPDFLDEENKIVYEVKPNKLVKSFMEEKGDAVDKIENSGYRFIIIDEIYFSKISPEQFCSIADHPAYELFMRSIEHEIKFNKGNR